MSLLNFFLQATRKRYLLVKYLFDLILWTLAAPLAFVIRLDANVVDFTTSIALFTSLSAVLKAALLWVYGPYRQSWHKVGVRDLYMLLRVIGLGTIMMLALAFLLDPVTTIPRSIPVLDGLLAIVLLSGIRLSFRLIHEQKAVFEAGSPVHKQILIVGAGEAGTLLAREMIRHPESGLKPIGFLDDDRLKRRVSILGLPVLGEVSSLARVVRETNPDEVLIAMPSAAGDSIRKVVKMARKADVAYRIIPGLYDILGGNVSISHIREVDVEDLLRREPVRLSMDDIASYIEGQSVLVTGSSGSIGSELVRQLVPFNPAQVILLDHNENGQYTFRQELTTHYANIDLVTIVADIQREEKIQSIFAEYRPQVVFHAAAHKHVPLMESHPDEAVLNNVRGTMILVEASVQYGVECFVNISTDKAVRPASVMGATKRVAEHIVARAAQTTGPHQTFVSVRFGNVLGSSGSVVPLFKQQIKEGGPVTVTDPAMTRYFMSIPEATQLVLQAAGLRENGAIYILDMGEPVRIVDLARDLIELSGLVPDEEISITYIGPRAGEKLHEELLTPDEGMLPTKYEKIHSIQKNGARKPTSDSQFQAQLEMLLAAAEVCDINAIRACLQEMLPSYQPYTEQPISKAAD